MSKFNTIHVKRVVTTVEYGVVLELSDSAGNKFICPVSKEVAAELPEALAEAFSALDAHTQAKKSQDNARPRDVVLH